MPRRSLEGSDCPDLEQELTSTVHQDRMVRRKSRKGQTSKTGEKMSKDEKIKGGES